MQLQTTAQGEAAPKRRRTRKRDWRAKWIKLTNSLSLDAIKQTMRCPKLLSAAKPRVILKEKYLQKPRSPESEFGLRFVLPKKELERRMGERRGRTRRERQRRQEFRESDSPLYLAYPILDRGRTYDADFKRRLVRGRRLSKRRVLDRRSKKQHNRKVVKKAVYDKVTGRKSWRTITAPVDLNRMIKNPSFRPSAEAARVLRDKDVSPFKK
jgi:hypothetical protein